MAEEQKTLTIDIVDDDDAVRDSMFALLESFGYKVREYSSAEVYISGRPGSADCLLLDQHMPGMTGLDLLARLRAQGDTTPALMISGRSDSTIEPQAKALGAQVLHKPVNDEELILLIEQTCHEAQKKWRSTLISLSARS